MAAGDLITNDWQVEWRGTLLGHGTSYGWVNLSGWLDLPGARLKYQSRPGRHGAFAGQLLVDERLITLDYVIAPFGQSFSAAVDALRLLTAMEEAPDEQPLVIQLSGTKWRVMARCIRRSLPAERMYAAGASSGSIQWVASDPRLYSAALQSASAGLPQPGLGGLVFPVVFPLTFGSGLAGGTLSLVNAGTITTFPVWTITGPVPGAQILNVDTGDQLGFNPAFTVPGGQTCVIDADARTVTMQGINRRDQLFTANWFGLKPGITNVRFSGVGAPDPAAQLAVTWRHATI